jgi:hypothetical protein
MRTPLSLSVGLALTFCTFADAADGSSHSFIKTTSGKVYSNCRVFKTDPDGVIIAHQHGGAKLLFADLTEESREMLGYDAEKAAKYEKDRAEQKKKYQEDLWKYRCEVAKAQAAAYTAEARRMEVIAVQNLAYGGGFGGYGFGYDGFGFGYGGNGYGRDGYYGRDCGPYGYGHGYGRFGGYGGTLAFGSPTYGGFVSPFGGSPLRLITRGGTTLPTPCNFGTMNTNGRTFFAPPMNKFSIGTPSHGRGTPSLGGRRK